MLYPDRHWLWIQVNSSALLCRCSTQTSTGCEFRSTHQHCNADALPRPPLDVNSGQLISIAMQMLYPDLHRMWIQVNSSALQCRCSTQTPTGCEFRSTHQHCYADALPRPPLDVNSGQLISIAMQMLYPDLHWMWIQVNSSALQCRCSIQTSTGCEFRSTHQHCHADALSRPPLDVNSGQLISIAMQMLYPDFHWMWIQVNSSALQCRCSTQTSTGCEFRSTHQHCYADALPRPPLDVNSGQLISIAMQMLYPDFHWMWIQVNSSALLCRCSTQTSTGCEFRSTHQHCNADALSRLPLDVNSGQLISIAMQMLYPDLHWMWIQVNSSALLCRCFIQTSTGCEFRSTHQHCNADALPRPPLDVNSGLLISIAMQMLYPDLHWMWIQVNSSALQCRCSIQTATGCEFRSTHQHYALSRPPLDVKDCSNGSEVTLFNIHQIKTLPVTATKIQRATHRDPVLSQVLHFTWKGWPEEEARDFSVGGLFTMGYVCHYSKMFTKSYTLEVPLRLPRKLSNEIACPQSSLVTWTRIK